MRELWLWFLAAAGWLWFLAWLGAPSWPWRVALGLALLTFLVRVAGYGAGRGR